MIINNKLLVVSKVMIPLDAIGMVYIKEKGRDDLPNILFFCKSPHTANSATSTASMASITYNTYQEAVAEYLAIINAMAGMPNQEVVLEPNTKIQDLKFSLRPKRKTD